MHPIEGREQKGKDKEGMGRNVKHIKWFSISNHFTLLASQSRYDTNARPRTPPAVGCMKFGTFYRITSDALWHMLHTNSDSHAKFQLI